MPLGHIRQGKPRNGDGVKEYNHLMVKCASCKVSLIGILVTDAGINQTWTIKPITCPFCGDHSFKEEIGGKIHLAGTDRCKITDITYDDNQINIQVQ